MKCVENQSNEEHIQRTLGLTILIGYKLDDKLFFHQEVNNFYSPVIMTGKLGIFIFDTITLMFYLTSKFYFVCFILKFYCLTTMINN